MILEIMIEFIHGVVLGGTPSLDRWLSSIQIKTSYLDSTGVAIKVYLHSLLGGHVWNASYRLFHYIHEMSQDVFDASRTYSVLELGAGCGWLGMALASQFPQIKVCKTM
jgi:hypothetical protein